MTITMKKTTTDGKLDPKQVKRLRERLRLTQKQMAQRMGVSLRSVIRWEQGTSVPHPVFTRMMREL